MRIRITFSKNEAMRYTGHLDLQRAWERTFRRARLPLAYTQGFHPQARLNLACALPLGFTSQCELLDAWLEGSSPLPEIQLALEAAAPPGFTLLELVEVEPRLPALQTQVIAAEYTLTLLEAVPDLEERILRLVSSPSLPRERRGKPYDLRSLVEAISLLTTAENGMQRVHLRLTAREGATGRPEEVLDVLGIPLEAARVHRTGLVMISPGN